MAASEALGIKGLHSIHYFVSEAERSARFYQQAFGWQAAWQATPELVARGRQTSTVYQAGDIRVAVSTPVGEGGRAWRYLRRHPAGIGTLNFEVEDLDAAYAFLAERGGTFVHGIQTSHLPDGGRYRDFVITTAIGDVAFRFCERRDTQVFAPGFEALPTTSDNPLGFGAVDHITSNAQTMASVGLWFEHVLGMERYWGIEFHTEDVKHGGETGTGLRSIVYWDPRSGLKFPINEPLSPFFKEGQINRFIEDNAGAGVQHIALQVADVVESVRTLRQRGIAFLETPGSYYDQAPARLLPLGVDVQHIAHDLNVLRELGILIDGSPDDRYLIQIFLKDAMTLYNEPQAGPFFFELIQRCGDPGFGGGNFRALFEAIEREQLGEP
ncbi:MAG: VOC family protein [Myxococcales bacterium]|nr:VOC family protein [Myxococcales bacterium]MCB9544343.1 VOC family protein [Myxococcales bacterium]